LWLPEDSPATVRFLPESAQVPLNGSQPMVGPRRERRELITTSKGLYSFSKGRSKDL
jgi:MFS transporter, MHS family, proline/betaine transporter